MIVGFCVVVRLLVSSISEWFRCYNVAICYPSLCAMRFIFYFLLYVMVPESNFRVLRVQFILVDYFVVKVLENRFCICCICLLFGELIMLVNLECF